jgi:hypothetical protein
MIRILIVATALVACTCVAATPVSAQFGQGNSPNNLFSQYVTPDGPNMTSSGMYPAPHYSPPLGAQAYYTYQPLMPHEMMYQHSRNYYNYYNSGGYYGGNDSLNKTSVRWQSGSNHMGPLPCMHGLGGLGYKIHKRKYCLDGECEGKSHCGRIRGIRGGVGCSDGGCGVSADSACGADVYSSPGCVSGGCAKKPNAISTQR